MCFECMMKDYSKYDDDQLMALLREKHPICNEAFNVLYFRYAERLKSYCLFKSENAEDAKEIHQDTWLRFHKSVLSGKNNISLPAYLYIIARNLCIDKYRIQKNIEYKNFDVNEFEQFADPLNLQSNLEKKELLSLVSLALFQLSDIYRETFILKWFAGLTYPEIAQIIGESVDCVKKRSSRAMDEVLRILKPIAVEINK